MSSIRAAEPRPTPSPRRALALLALAMVLGMSTWFSASAVTPQLRAQWGLTTNQASLLTIAVQVGFVVGAVGSAVLNLADVLPPKRLLVAAAAGAAAVNGLLAVADGAATAIALRFLTGVCLAGVYPVALKLVATWFRTGRGVALGVMVGALTLGSALPHLINGSGGLEWRQVILATSAMTLLAATLTAIAVREGPFPFPRAAFDPRQAGQVWSNRGIRLASLGYFGHMWELYAMWAWFLAFYTDALRADGHAIVDGPAALGTFAVIGSGAAGCWAGGVLGDRWGRTNTTAAAMTVSGACALLSGFLFGSPAWVVLTLGLVWGVAVVADSAQFSTMVSELADQSYVGTALTLQLAAGFVLTVVTIWLIPVFRDHWGWEWAFAFLAPGPALGVVAMLYLKRLPEARLIAGGRG